MYIPTNQRNLISVELAGELGLLAADWRDVTSDNGAELRWRRRTGAINYEMKAIFTIWKSLPCHVIFGNPDPLHMYPQFPTPFEGAQKQAFDESYDFPKPRTTLWTRAQIIGRKSVPWPSNKSLARKRDPRDEFNTESRDAIENPNIQNDQATTKEGIWMGLDAIPEDSSDNKEATAHPQSDKCQEEPLGVGLGLEPEDNARTDSGYTSGARRKLGESHIPAGKDLESINEGAEMSHGESFSSDHDQLYGLYNTGTIYSNSVTSTLQYLQDKDYIADFTRELLSHLKACRTTREDLGRISHMLPDLLRSFALKLGYKAQTSIYREVSVFIHRYRR